MWLPGASSRDDHPVAVAPVRGTGFPLMTSSTWNVDCASGFQLSSIMARVGPSTAMPQ
jgi:hypothetical protein